MKNAIAILLFLTMAFTQCGCSGGRGRVKATDYISKVSPKDEIQAEIAALKARPVEYYITDGDTLEVLVWEVQELTRDVVVRPDGRITFPLIGEVDVAGLTIRELAGEIAGRLTEYVREPQVTVSLKAFGGKKVVVLGEVRTPGVYRYAGPIRLLEAIGMAGGFTDSAVMSNVIILRGGPQNPVGISVNAKRIIKQAALKENIALRPDDIVYVPRSFISNVNRFVSTIGPYISTTASALALRETIVQMRRGD